MTAIPDPELDEEAILQACLDRPEGEQLDELERQCTAHPALAAGLRQRYAALARHGLVSLPLAPGMRFGEYRLVAELGRGGMGVVYLAEHVGLGRRVALKLLSPLLLDSERATERFKREIAAMARIDHPGICPIYEAGGVHGQPFLAMRYVPGPTLAEQLAEQLDAARAGGPIAVATAVAWLADLAEAVAAAHAGGLVHRDLKPANVVLADDGRPVVLDFGLARDLHGDAPTLTQSRDPIGTPSYMAPEQVQGGEVGPWTDVHALGAMLYEVLTLTTAFPGTQRTEVFHRVLTEAPIRLRHLRPDAPRDLELVVEVCLDKDPRRRYARAGDLAEDLRRIQARQPIRARGIGTPLRLWRWAQRNRAAAITLGFVSVLAATSTFFLWRSATADRAARVRGLVFASIEAQSDSQLAALYAKAAYRLQPEPETLDQLRSALFETHELGVQRGEGVAPHTIVLLGPRHYLVLGQVPEAQILEIDHERPTARLPTDGMPLVAVVSPGGTIAIGTDSGAVHLYGPDGTARWPSPLRLEDVRVNSMAWTDDRHLVVTGADRALLVDTTGPTYRDLPLAESGLRGNIAAAISADRTTMLFGARGAVEVWTVEGGEPRPSQVLEGFAGAGPVLALDISADGSSILAAASNRMPGTFFAGPVQVHAIMVWHRTAAGFEPGPRITGYAGMVLVARLSPDGERLAFCTMAGTVAIHDARTGAPLGNHVSPSATMAPGLAWAPDSARLCVTTVARTARLFGRDGEARRTLRGAGVWDAAFASDGSLLTVDIDAVRRHRPALEDRLEGHLQGLYFATECGDGTFVTGGRDPSALRWRDGKVIGELRDPEYPSGWNLHCTAEPGGGILLGNSDTRVRRFAPDGRVTRSPALDGFVSRVLPLPDGRVVAVRQASPGAVVLSSNLQEVTPLDGSRNAWGGAVTPNGRWFAVAGQIDHRLQVWDLLKTPPTKDYEVPFDAAWRVYGVAIAPDGKAVFVGGGDGWLQRFDLRDGSHRRWLAHDGPILDIDVAADGRIATCGNDTTAAVWSPDGTRLALLRGHAGAVWTARFLADGRRILTASEDRTARIWLLDGVDVLALAERRLRPADRRLELDARAALVGDLLDGR